MARDNDSALQLCCPFINLGDARCRGQLSLRRLHAAFELCVGQPHRCETFHQLARDQEGGPLQVTVLGQPARRQPARRSAS